MTRQSSRAFGIEDRLRMKLCWRRNGDKRLRPFWRDLLRSIASAFTCGRREFATKTSDWRWVSADSEQHSLCSKSSFDWWFSVGKAMNKLLRHFIPGLKEHLDRHLSDA